MSGDPADKSQLRLPSWRPRPSEADSSATPAPSSLTPVSTDDIDDAWASADNPRSSERAKPFAEVPKPVSERKPMSAPPKPLSERPPAVRVTSKPPPKPTTASARGRTLLGIAPIADGSSDPASAPPSSSPPVEWPDSGRAKFEAAARLLEQKRASLAPGPPSDETDTATAPTNEQEAVAAAAVEGDASAEATPEMHDAEAPAVEASPGAEPPHAAETADAASPSVRDTRDTTPPSSRRQSERVDAPPQSRRRRRSSAPPPQRTGIVPIALAAAVFVVMFSVGAIRALREEFRNGRQSTTSSVSVVERAPAATPVASPAALPTAEPSVVATETPSAVAAGESSPATSAAEPVASASAEAVHAEGVTSVLVRASVSGARFYRHGKQIGMNSVIVDLAPGEKRAFEVDLPGYVPRKVVVDGSQSEVVVVLPRISEAPSAPTRAGHEKDEATASGPQVQAEP